MQDPHDVKKTISKPQRVLNQQEAEELALESYEDPGQVLAACVKALKLKNLS